MGYFLSLCEVLFFFFPFCFFYIFSNHVFPVTSCPEVLHRTVESLSCGSLLGSVATFRCSPHERQIGARNATCQADGTWSAPPPTCEGKRNFLILIKILPYFVCQVLFYMVKFQSFKHVKMYLFSSSKFPR